MGNDCWRRFQMGALMGASVGACIGVLFGTLSIMRHGHGGHGFLRTIGKLALQSGASFGLFMGIGAGLRCDDDGNDYRIEQRRASSIATLYNRQATNTLLHLHQ